MLLLSLLLVALPAYATDPLIERLKDSAEALKKGDYEKALKIDERLIRLMLDELGPGDAESKWFSVTVAHRALALAGLHRDDEAIWYWHVALNLYPAIEQGDMSMFGAPAEFLKAHPLGPPPPSPMRDASQRPASALSSDVRAPKYRRRTEPLYPRGMRAFHETGSVILECVIGANGDVRDVRLLKGLRGATLSYAAMEALHQWKFEPGTLDGKPVDVIFNLTINFRLSP
jgi:TonB family protein